MAGSDLQCCPAISSSCQSEFLPRNWTTDVGLNGLFSGHVVGPACHNSSGNDVLSAKRKSTKRGKTTGTMKFHLRSHHASQKKSPRQHGRTGGIDGRWLCSALVCCLPMLLLLSGECLLGGTKPEADSRIERVRTIVDRLRNNLSIPNEVFVSIVPKNKRLISVERTKDARAAFILSFDGNFLDTLNDNELTAAIAHELGHIWIFTHHPFLQTELLANQIAMKAVTRESLEQVYERVWKDTGTKRDIQDLLGQ